jgi:DNA-binding Lrp family transcriptional regulator
MPPPPTADTILDLEVRRRIVEFVRANPGLHMRELAGRLDLAVSTLEYHCYQLVKHGQLVTRESAGFKAFYQGEGMDRRDKDILYLVRHEAPRRICQHVLLNPGTTPKDLRAALNVSAPTLSFHLNKLRGAGVLREEPAGRTKNLYVEDPERVANILVTYRASFLDDAVDRFAAAWLALAPPSLPKKEAELDAEPVPPPIPVEPAAPRADEELPPP